MERNAITTPHAPKALGPYSQAIRHGNLVFSAGQIGIDPATGKLVEGGIEAQTRRVLQNLAAILEAAGTSLAEVVKTTVFMTNLDEFAAMNGVYAAVLAEHGVASHAARSTVQVSRLPAGALVEIDAIAVISEG